MLNRRSIGRNRSSPGLFAVLHSFFSDGGFRRGTGRAAAGYAAYVRNAAVGVPRLVAFAGRPLQSVRSAFLAEVLALDMALAFLLRAVG